MHLLTNVTAPALWYDVLKHAQSSCSIALQGELEGYLIALLMRYTNKPEVVKQVIATTFLKALDLRDKERSLCLQAVGDNCLLFTGLFPRVAVKRHVKLSYFVNIGQSAYSAISKDTNDIYSALALQFVALMDVLQAIRPDPDLKPLEAYEQWDEVGSKRALKILQSYTNGFPSKRR